MKNRFRYYNVSWHVAFDFYVKSHCVRHGHAQRGGGGGMQEAGLCNMDVRSMGIKCMEVHDVAILGIGVQKKHGVSSAGKLIFDPI